MWVAWFNVVLCIVVAVVGGVGFLWPIAWVCWVFVAEKKREEVRKKLIKKMNSVWLRCKKIKEKQRRRELT